MEEEAPQVETPEPNQSVGIPTLESYHILLAKLSRVERQRDEAVKAMASAREQAYDRLAVTEILTAAIQKAEVAQ